MNKVSIIILMYNNLDYNIQCIESIRQFTKKGSYEIVVVDNGSTDGTREWLVLQKDLKVILPTENTGFPKGCNLGIKAAEKENDILLLNNDIVVTPNWLDILTTALYSNENIGAVGPTTNYAWNCQSIPINYNSTEEMIGFSQKVNISDKSKWEEKIKLIGFCLLVKREVLNIIGLLDERFSPGNFEDDDLCMRILEAGYKMLLCRDCFIHHYGNLTFNKEPKKFTDVLSINSAKFRAKWNFKAPETDEDKYEMLNQINEPKENALNILQINSGFGVTLLRAKYLYPNSNIFGIETNENIANLTKSLFQTSTKPINDFTIEFEETFFDYILLGDYLEYCNDPGRLLKELKKHLKPHGYIIATIRNLIHYSVIRDLFKGNFTSIPNNIIDKTQTTFFTYNDICKIAEESGCSSPYVIYLYNIRNEDDDKFLNSICSIAGEDMRWNFISYKYIVKIQNK
ncbi:MAG: glycosyltransferase family 2 protein [Clostridiaceae bacterium]